MHGVPTSLSCFGNVQELEKKTHFLVFFLDARGTHGGPGDPGKARGPPGSPGYPFPGFPLGSPGPPWVPLASLELQTTLTTGLQKGGHEDQGEVQDLGA